MPRNALRICLLLSSSGKSEYKRILARNSPSHPSRSDSLLDSHPLMPKMAETFSWQFVSNIYRGRMQDRFTSHEVIDLTGITPRQLQWWDERGVVRPEREGHRRMYSMNHLTEVAVICELRRKGFSLQSVRKVMRFLGREFGKGLAEIMSHGSEYHLLTDGTHLYLETSARQIVDILKNSSQPIIGVCLSDAVRQVRAEVVSRKTNTSVTSPVSRRRAKNAS
jgi:DNA-binding transcriptional MerR regulator